MLISTENLLQSNPLPLNVSAFIDVSHACSPITIFFSIATMPISEERLNILAGLAIICMFVHVFKATEIIHGLGTQHIEPIYEKENTTFTAFSLITCVD